MNLIKRFISNTGYSIINDFLIRIGNTLIIIFLSKQINSSAAGIINLALTYIYIGLVVSNWGFGNLLIREVAKKKDYFDQAFPNFAIARFSLGLLTTIVIIILANNVSNYSVNTRLVIQIIAFTIPFDSINMLSQSAFNAFEKLRLNGIVSLIMNSFKIVLGYLLITRVNNPLIAIAFLYLIISISAVILNLFLINEYLSKIKFNLNLPFCLSQFKLAIPFFVLAIFLAIDTKIDVILLSFFVSEDKIGLYSAMNTILGIMYLLPEGIRNSIFPIFAKYEGSDPLILNKWFPRVIKYLLIITFPIVFVGLYFSEQLVFLLFTHEFRITIQLLQIGIFSFITYTLTNVVSRLLIVKNFERSVTFAWGISCFFTVVTNLILIPKWGVFGAAIVKTSSSILLFMLLLLVTQRKLKIIPKNSKIFFVFTSGLIISLLSFYPIDINNFVKSIISIILYFVLLILLKVFTQEDRIFLNIIFNPARILNNKQ